MRGGGGVGMTPGYVAVCSLSPLSPQVAAPISPSPPGAPPLLPWPILTSLTHPSFPLGGCANGAPGLSLFHCSVSSPHGGGQLRLPLARCVQADTPIPALGDSSPTAAFQP